MILPDKALPLLKSAAFHVPQDQHEKILDTCMDAVDTEHLCESRGQEMPSQVKLAIHPTHCATFPSCQHWMLQKET